MRKATPSLNAIRAFESAARHESFSKAAEELGVSSSAISQQVAQLEDDLGIRLFERKKQRLSITDAGSKYRNSLSAALDRIESATTDLISNKGVQRLRIGSLPSLASHWLIPRLPRFIEENPSISLQVVTLELDFSSPERSPNLQGGRIDVGLFFGDGHWEGLDSKRLMHEELVPVVAPKLIERNGLGDDANDIIECLPRLLHSTRPQSWEDWFRSQGKAPLAENGSSFEHFHMLIDAARSEIGVALVPLSFVERELENNSLVRLGRHSLVAERAYYLVSDPANGLSKAKESFCSWLEKQVSFPLKLETPTREQRR